MIMTNDFILVIYRVILYPNPKMKDMKRRIYSKVNSNFY